MSSNVKAEFTNHFRDRVMEIDFPEGLSITSEADLQKLKTDWSNNLSSWHTPYTCVFDAHHVEIAPALRPAFAKLVDHFKTFFMRKIVGFFDENSAEQQDSFAFLPFEVIAGRENALRKAGVREHTGPTQLSGDLRSQIQVENHFEAQMIEISFAPGTQLKTAADVRILQSKIENILVMWHSAYSVVVDCANCDFSDEAREAFAKTAQFLKGFFCKRIVGYHPQRDKKYPFHVFRSRHLALESLEIDKNTHPTAANCATRKSPQMPASG